MDSQFNLFERSVYFYIDQYTIQYTMCCLHHTCSPAPPPLQRLLFEAAEGGQTDRLTRLLDRCQQVGVSLSEWSDRRSISGVPQLHNKLKSELINQSAVDDWVRAGRWDEVRQTSPPLPPPPPERPPVCLLKSHHVRKYQAAAAAEWPCSLSSSCPPSFCFCHFLFGFHFLPVCFEFPVGGRGGCGWDGPWHHLTVVFDPTPHVSFKGCLFFVSWWKTRLLFCL